MAHLRSRRRPALTLPLGLALTASLGFLPGAAQAAPADSPATTARSATADAGALAYVVNTRTDHRTLASVKKAIAEAGGTVVTSYDRIGVIVVHASNPDFGRQIRAAKGVQSA
ncbi:peptidase S8, partial [Streptomyces sp. A475]